MRSPAKKFIQSRRQKFALTLQRVNYIFSYINFCYETLLTDKIQYSRKWVSDNTKDKFENFLKKKLVHDYLKKYKGKFPSASGLEEILFECEPEMPYYYYDSQKQTQVEANDRIDIKVNRIGLQHVWKNVEDQDIYLAIECKILSKLSDNSHYLADIQKFCNRQHIHYRLPIEGMIAFAESQKPTISDLTNDLNKRLENSQTIITRQPLIKTEIAEFKDSYYNSRQLRNYGIKNEFSICHLYLDYSGIIAQ